MQSYTLYELNEYIKRVLALNFDEGVWISCEITQARNVKGNFYLELVQQEEGKIIAQTQAVIWNKTGIALRKKLGNLLNPLLRIGSHVKAKVQVSFHERYGMSLVIEDLDPTYTMGQMSIRRQEIIDKLKNDGYYGKNALVNLASVPQNIAIISSETAAGYQDFINHLATNSFGYQFRTEIFQSSMQGDHTEADVSEALYLVGKQAERFDAVVIIRGGGSKLDLSYFDSYLIGKAIADCPVPVITGIGHDIDESVADILSHTALKTPTSVADYLIERFQIFEANLIEVHTQIRSTTDQLLKNNNLRILNLTQQIEMTGSTLLSHAKSNVTNTADKILATIKSLLIHQRLELNSFEKILLLSDPNVVLKKGYTYLTRENRPIKLAKDLKSGDKVKAHFSDGTTDLTVD